MRALEVLQANSRGAFTIPARGLYPYQWLWDSGFIALGWAQVDMERAWQELLCLFDYGQSPDGMLPHIVFHEQSRDYFPGPEVWGREALARPATSGITQPPVVGSVLLYLYEKDPDRERARERARYLFPKALAFHRWLYLARDPWRTGLVAIVHPWESGMDNSPAWDKPLSRVPLEDLPPYERRDVRHVSPEERPKKEDYDRYLSLLFLFRRLGYDPRAIYEHSPFKVVDVGFNAILHRANRDLYTLAVLLGEDPGDLEEWILRGEVGLEALWDRERGFYFSLDLVAGERIPVKTSAGFLPLYAGTPHAGRAGFLAEEIRRWGEKVAYLLPSADPESPAFEPKRYWRGPIWINVNYLVAEGLKDYGFLSLAERLKADALALMEREGFREYYDPLTGQGRGGEAFSWSAALALYWT
ncbi:trehalase family glycosidase [Thermus composti]|uniref:Trehalase family glycosidase n=1 Tax=Thermus composti TaxID=532059 RepID=A0ABV6PY43_9DEIN|nr:trehalase family glycosidase [Thermus composti]